MTVKEEQKLYVQERLDNALEKIEELAGQFLAEVETLFRAVTEAEMV